MSNRRYLLSDLDVARFVVNGYLILKPRFRKGLHEEITQKLDKMRRNPGDAITDVLPELKKIVDHSSVKGACTSLLGKNYELKTHRHWHLKPPGSDFMHWHQDSTNNRRAGINQILALYYPHDVTAEMGPTIIAPGTQFRNAPTDRMATYTNIRGQIALTVKAGTIALTHYDLWHGTAANRSRKKRHMVKFLVKRTSENITPSWNHQPDVLARPANSDIEVYKNAGDVRNILTSSNPLNVGQSDRLKERAIRIHCWKLLMGEPTEQGSSLTL